MSDFTPNPNDHELIALMQRQKDRENGIETQDAPSITLEQQFINRLTATRQEAGMAQVTLAERAQLPQSAIARIESGRGNPTLKTLTKLADAMGYQLTLLRKQD